VQGCYQNSPNLTTTTQQPVGDLCSALTSHTLSWLTGLQHFTQYNFTDHFYSRANIYHLYYRGNQSAHRYEQLRHCAVYPLTYIGFPWQPMSYSEAEQPASLRIVSRSKSRNRPFLLSYLPACTVSRYSTGSMLKRRITKNADSCHVCPFAINTGL
jgi:hypothetical protein